MKQIITQKNFVEKLKRRNEKALEYVIREYGGYVKAAVNHNLAGLPEEMEECMDDVFMDVWEHIERFDAAKGSFKNWIVSIARFRSIDYLRRYSRTCMEEDVSNYESELAKNDRIDTLEQEISMETEKLLEGLKEAGIEEGVNLEVEYQNSQADTGTASQIADSFISQNVDMICAIATPSAMSAYNSAMAHETPRT